MIFFLRLNVALMAESSTPEWIGLLHFVANSNLKSNSLPYYNWGLSFTSLHGITVSLSELGRITEEGPAP